MLKDKIDTITDYLNHPDNAALKQSLLDLGIGFKELLDLALQSPAYIKAITSSSLVVVSTGQDTYKVLYPDGYSYTEASLFFKATGFSPDEHGVFYTKHINLAVKETVKLLITIKAIPEEQGFVRIQTQPV